MGAAPVSAFKGEDVHLGDPDGLRTARPGSRSQRARRRRSTPATATVDTPTPSSSSGDNLTVSSFDSLGKDAIPAGATW
jgi:hypothetical protein